MGRLYSLALCVVLAGVGGSSSAADDYWLQLGNNINGVAIGDRFGNAVSLSADGNRVAVGAPEHDTEGYVDNDSGQVQVYEFSHGVWQQLGAAMDGQSRNEVGSSVALSSNGSRVAIGSPGTSSGVRIYEFMGGIWAQMGGSVGESPDSSAGRSVSISGDGTRVVVGAPYPYATPGAVRAYEWNGDQWLQLGGDITGESNTNLFGNAISLSSNGERVAIGGPLNDGSGQRSGHIRVYRWTGNDWDQMGSDIDGKSEGYEFGSTVALSADGQRVVGGSLVNDMYESYVEVFEWSGTSWVTVAGDINVSPAGPASIRDGYSVALSSDGSRLVIGDILNKQVRVYEFDELEWTLVGQAIVGVNSYTGKSVSLSADGTRLAFGAQGSEYQSDFAGEVSVFEFPYPHFQNFHMLNVPLIKAAIDFNADRGER